MNTRERESSGTANDEATLRLIEQTLSDFERRLDRLEAQLNLDPVEQQALAIVAPAPRSSAEIAAAPESDILPRRPATPIRDPEEAILSIDNLQQPAAQVDRIIINVISDDLEPLPDPDIEAPNDDEVANTACCLRAKRFRPLLYIGPISVALTEAADVGRSLYKSGNTSLAITITAGSAAFLSSIGLTGETTKKNFDLSCDIIKHRKLPNDWPKLSRGKEAIAVSLVIIPAVWGPIAKSMQAYYFMDALPSEYNFEQNINLIGWAVGSSLVAFGAGATDILTNDAEMYKIVRERLAGQHTPYSNKFSKIVSPWLGGTLGLMNAAQDSMQSYIAIKTIFDVTSVHGRIMIAVPSALNMVPSFSFDGMYSINAMDDLFGYLQQRRLEPTKMLAFSMSAALAVYLAFLKRGLNLSFYSDVTKDFGADPNNVPAQVFESLSWAMFVQDSVQGTATLYEPMYGLITRVSNKVASAGRCLFGFFCASRDNAPEDHLEARAEERDVEQGPPSERTPLLSASRSAASPLLYRDQPEEVQDISPPARRKKKSSESWCGVM